ADTDWDVAEPGYRFSFPRDHCSHDGYRIEWWYYTGNLTSTDGRRFGYQLTFFRTGVVRHPLNPSRWAIRDLYMAHFAISDISNDSFSSFQRLNRAGVGWAGADQSSYHVWNEDWQVRLDGSDHILNARDGDYSIDFKLSPEKPEVEQGEGGISKKGAAPGNASHYYSITRLRTSGELEVAGQKFQVNGSSWMDHEFGSSFLEPGQVGWDWFSIQLDDGRDIMLVELRRSDGSIDPYSNGTIVDAAGKAHYLKFGDFSLVPGKTWRSSNSGAKYPVGWTVDIPAERIHLDVEAAIQDQELRTASTTEVTYWEGSVNIAGETAGKPVHGGGYLEMTGYANTAGLGVLMH
ncbi:MAG: lipocalin-like domain-containing protein, partial [Blastocatellia bacterium]